VRTVALLGSTGSIGTQALDVAAAHPDRFRVTALAAGANAELVVAQARTHRVGLVALADADAARRARAALAGTRVDGRPVEVLGGPEGVEAVAAGAGGPHDVVLNGMVGSRGLRPTLAALAAGSTVALANKESLIVGGHLVLDAAAAAAAGPDRPDRPDRVDRLDRRNQLDRLVPVDSEHSALAQCLRGGRADEVARLVITASGGPFRGRSRADLATVTVGDALAHPTWEMGAVITINSASLANKGLEVIEAHLLFGIPYDRIDVVVHPQSVVHGMVEFVDGAVVAKLSPPDMRLPIQLALAWPHRLDRATVRMDWTRALELQFEPLDADTFPMVALAVAAGRTGGSAPAAYNAANEEAVAAFRDRRLPFLGIADVVAAVLEAHDPDPAGARDLEVLLAAEQDARRRARHRISTIESHPTRPPTPHPTR